MCVCVLVTREILCVSVARFLVIGGNFDLTYLTTLKTCSNASCWPNPLFLQILFSINPELDEEFILGTTSKNQPFRIRTQATSSGSHGSNIDNASRLQHALWYGKQSFTTISWFGPLTEIPRINKIVVCVYVCVWRPQWSSNLDQLLPFNVIFCASLALLLVHHDLLATDIHCGHKVCCRYSRQLFLWILLFCYYVHVHCSWYKFKVDDCIYI